MASEAATTVKPSSMETTAAMEAASRETSAVETSMKAAARKRMPVSRSERRAVWIEVMGIVTSECPRRVVNIER